MKNMKRAERRHRTKTKFLRRVELWFCTYFRNKNEEKKAALSGKEYSFLKTTSRPCRCYVCKKEKYKREQKQYLMKCVFE